MVNADINIAVVREMPEKEFDAVSKGLGTVAPLKPNPGVSEADLRLSRLKILKALF
jgi:hypothetical protein